MSDCKLDREALRKALTEITDAADKLILLLPGHWHDDATIELNDAAADARAVLSASVQNDLYKSVGPSTEDIAAAIDAADRGYKIELTSLTETVRVYTLTIPKGGPKLIFDNIEDAQDYAERHRSIARAKAALSAVAARGACG